MALANCASILAKLLGKKEAVMQDALWKPLVGMQWAALREVLPAEIAEAMASEMALDESDNRRGLRWCFLALLALALTEGNAALYEEQVAAVETRLGIENDKDQAQNGRA